MKVSFRVGRYLVALLWSWSVPALIGGLVGYSLSTWHAVQIIKASDYIFNESLDVLLSRVAESCSIPPDPPDPMSPPVSVTGQRLNPSQPTHLPPVAGAGGETG